ncbi:MAG: VWA domain-containing protein [Planctomycetia bacterium]|nr:VWA domain-containing protein [Planctomycetia bacterium]
MPAEPRSDDQLDALLRQVRVPRAWHARLSSIVDEVDPLERQLLAVPVPGGLHARLGAVVAEEQAATAAAQAGEAAFDARLRAVTIPWGLHYRLRSIAARRPIAVRRMLTMAALFLLLATWEAALFVAHYGSLFGTRLGPAPFIASSVVDVSPREQGVEELHVPKRATPNEYRDISPVAIAASSPLTATAAEPIETEYTRIRDADRRRLSAARSGRADIFQSVAWAMGTLPDAGDVRGARPADTLPDLARPALRKPRGIDARLNAGDRKFLLDYGIFPSVSTREFPTSIVPLSHDTAGYEAVRAALAAGEWPTFDQARPEDFLAAVDFGYGRPSDKSARLYVAGAIAPWSPTGAAAQAPATPNPMPVNPADPERISRLLQLSVQARELPAAARKPMHLTIGIDVTESMRVGGKLAMAKRALKTLIESLSATDRLTLVALGGANPVVVEDAGRAELEQLLAAVDWLHADGGGNLAEGVLQTIAVAGRREPPKNMERRVVVVSDALDETNADGIYLVEQLLKTSAARQLGFDLIDVRNEPEATAWDGLVRRRSGRVFAADTGERMRSALLEALGGRSQTVAKRASLTVTFNPQTVVAYRLVGHEPTAVTGLAPHPVEIDLNAGQTGTLLYEVQFNGGKDPLAATAVLRWQDPADGSAQEATQKITRAMLGGTFDKSPPQLQLATIATAVAARLRNSPWGDNVAPDEVLQWAVRLERTGIVRGAAPWRELVLQMQRLPARRAPTRGIR